MLGDDGMITLPWLRHLLNVGKVAQSGNRLDVKMFGAVGDGATDDSSVFTGGIGYLASGGVLYVPPGRRISPTGSNAYLLATAPAWPAADGAMVVLDPGASLSGAGSFIPNPSVSALHFYKRDNLPAAAAAGAGVINGYLSPALRIDVVTQSGNCTASSCGLLIYMPSILGLSYTKTTQVITGGGGAQSVAVEDSSVFEIGEYAAFAFGMPDAEGVVVTAVPDGTHVSAVFVGNHASGVKCAPFGKGDKIGLPVAVDDAAGNTSSIYCANMNIITRSAKYHTVVGNEIDVTNSSGVNAGFYGGSAPYMLGMSILAVGLNLCTYGIWIGPGEAAGGFLNGLSIVGATVNGVSVGYGGASRPANGINVWNAINNGLIIGANQTHGDDPRFTALDPTIGIFLTARISYDPVNTESNKIRLESMTSSVAHTMDIYHGQSGSGVRLDYDGTFTGVAVTSVGQIDCQNAIRIKDTVTNVDVGRLQNVTNSFTALYGGGTENSLIFYSTVAGSGVKGFFGFYDNSADGNVAAGFNTSNGTFQFRGTAPLIRLDGGLNQVAAYALFSDGGSPIAPVLKGRFVYAGDASAGSKYIGIQNDSADYIGLIGDVRITGSLTVGGSAIVGLPDQTGHSGQFLKTNGTVADWAALAQSDIPAMFTDRGDPAAVDKSGAGFTQGAWTDWDLSAIVPAGATSVLLRVAFICTSGAGELNFRKNGNSNVVNISRTASPANVLVQDDLIVACDSGRLVEYYLLTATYSAVEATVAGWWK